jgi:hypothetical protein
MDIECDLIVLNAPKHVHFIWNKMLKFKTSNTIYNHDLYVQNFNYIFIFNFQNINIVLLNKSLSLKV